MNTCQAPYRLPERFYDRLESDIEKDRVTPEQAALEIMMVLATDHECGEPAIAIICHKGRPMHVCAWHEEQHRTLIAPLAVKN
jgi:hypothetical protein